MKKTKIMYAGGFYLLKGESSANTSFIEDKDGWHGKPLSKDELPQALAELGEVDIDLIGKVEKPA